MGFYGQGEVCCYPTYWSHANWNDEQELAFVESGRGRIGKLVSRSNFRRKTSQDRLPIRRMRVSRIGCASGGQEWCGIFGTRWGGCQNGGVWERCLHSYA